MPKRPITPPTPLVEEPMPFPVRRMPRRTVPLTLPEPYQDFTVTVWVNHPPEVREKLRASGEEFIDGFTAVVLDHDLVDFDGKPYPPAGDRALFNALPNEVALLICVAVFEESGKLPKLAAAR